MSIHYSPVTLTIPDGTLEEDLVSLTYICCREEARVIISYYARRWPIEEYHNAWKSGGMQVETLWVQTRDNLERMKVILSFIDVRVLALAKASRVKRRSMKAANGY